MSPIEISIQRQDFCLATQYQKLRQNSATGAVVTFVGLVRDFQSAQLQQVTSLELQHYPALAQAQLESIAQTAVDKWSLQKVDIIHRVGLLEVSDQIVYVGVAASHRHAAYEANQFIMDSLKSDVAFWKKIHRSENCFWADANAEDQAFCNDELPQHLRTRRDGK